MKKSAFTMIELIFVIVILGILATVAIPKLSGIEEDAYLGKAKSAIGSARSAVISLQGRAKLRNANFNITVESKSGTESTAAVVFANDDTSDVHYSSKFPISLSVNFSTNKLEQERAANDANASGMAALLGGEGREVWATVANDTDANNTDVTNTNVNDANWTYSSSTGRFSIN